MAKYFYSECSIDQFGPELDMRKVKTAIASATINGRKAKKVSLSRELLNYFKDSGKGKPHKVWFIARNKKSQITIVAVENENGEISLPNTGGSKGAIFVYSICAWLGAWTFSWPIMNAFFSRGDEDRAAFMFGTACGILTLVFLIKLLAKIKGFKRWPKGEIDLFTIEEKPLFSSHQKAAHKEGW
ncbi:hypothetical protein [Pseudomonas nitroreducens]|uniref:hypothetical protein n=2 Tax=Pseudomonas nitroreducens TaxID=46680 RepID=UPI001E3B50AC|nr:hypothetical protein [Pseudomonas nitroreducens]MCE4071521.1 hypothetical protein [Pseudomonas nitritireducens]